jgi:hypothetical protein
MLVDRASGRIAARNHSMHLGGMVDDETKAGTGTQII